MSRAARHRVPRAVAACAGLACVAGLSPGCASMPTGSPDAARLGPLRQLHVRGGRLGWDGLLVGMTHREVGAGVGKELALPESPDPAAGLGCEHPSLTAEVLGTRLVLEFSGTTEASRLVAIYAVLTTSDRPLDLAALRAAVLDRVEGLELVPSRHQAGVPEGRNTKTLYAVPGGGRVLVDPERGVYFGDVCVD